MQREDYEAVARIIEDLQYYLDNKIENVKIIKTEEFGKIQPSKYKNYSLEADKAMKEYTKKLNKENEKYKKQACTVSS